MRVLARQLRTPDALAVEVGLIIRSYCEREARRMVNAREAAPAGADLLSRMTRPHYLRMKAEQDARIAAEQEQAWAERMAIQKAREERDLLEKKG